jgi:hypothetical protein
MGNKEESMSTISATEFLKLKAEVKELREKLVQLADIYPEWIDIKTIAAKYNKKPATIKAYVKRNSSELGIGTLFKHTDFKVQNGIMFLHKNAVLKLGEHYG